METTPANVTNTSDPSAAFVAALRQRGATTPGAACPQSELPRISSSRLRELVDSGLVRESADGALYVYERATADGARQLPRGRGLVLAVAFWITAIIVPILLFRWAT